MTKIGEMRTKREKSLEKMVKRAQPEIFIQGQKETINEVSFLLIQLSGREDSISNKTFVNFFRFQQFLFITSETELDQYQQKVNEQVTSRVARYLKTRLRIPGNQVGIGNSKKIPEILRSDGEQPAGHPIDKIQHPYQKITKNKL